MVPKKEGQSQPLLYQNLKNSVGVSEKKSTVSGIGAG